VRVARPRPLRGHLLARPRRPGWHGARGPAHVGIEEYLFTYLRTLDASGNRLPAGFVAKLQQTLAHYGVAGLERTTLLEESLFRVFKARERGDEAVAPVLSILERRLARSRGLAPRLGDDFRGLLDRMVRPRSAGSPR